MIVVVLTQGQRAALTLYLRNLPGFIPLSYDILLYLRRLLSQQSSRVRAARPQQP